MNVLKWSVMAKTPALGWSAALILGVSAAWGGAPPGYIDASTFGGGWNATDATTCLQDALDSGENIWIPKESGDWLLSQTVYLRNSNQSIEFQSGTVVEAAKGAFATGGALFSGSGVSHVNIIGNGATVAMRAADYTTNPGTRQAFVFWSADNLNISNLNVNDAGGAGIAFGQGGNPTNAYINVSNCNFSNCDRNGISVLTADHLTITNCNFVTNGPHAPGAGIDIEPDAANRQLTNINVNNCFFQNNKGSQITVSLGSLTSASKPVSINFDQDTCEDTLAGGFPANDGVQVMNIRPGTQGSVNFTNMNINVPGGTSAIDILNKSATGARVSFGTNTTSGAVIAARGSTYPILLEDTDDADYGPFGGIDLKNVSFSSTFPEKGDFLYGLTGGGSAITDLQGSFYFDDPNAASYYLTQPQSNVNIMIGRNNPVPEPMEGGLAILLSAAPLFWRRKRV